MNAKLYTNVLFLIFKVSNVSNIISSCFRDKTDNYHWTLDNFCIEIVFKDMTWYDARTYCRQHGGDLLEIRSQHIQDSIATHLRKQHRGRNGFWFAANDINKEDSWRWLHSPYRINYSNWGSSEGPTGGGFLFGGAYTDCALVRTDDNYKWHDGHCNSDLSGYHYSFICQYELTSKATITTGNISTKERVTVTTSRIPLQNHVSTQNPTSAPNIGMSGECPFCQGQKNISNCKANVINCPKESQACVLTFTNSGAVAGCSSDIQECYRTTHMNSQICGYRPIPFDLHPEMNCSYCCDISSHNCFNYLLNQLVYLPEKQLG